MTDGCARRHLALGLVSLLVVGTTGCDAVRLLDPGGRDGRPGGGARIAGPPAVTVRAGEVAFDLRAWTYCFANGCADGAPPENPPDLGAAPQVEVEFPLDGWSFQAEFVPVGEECPRRQRVPVEQTGDHTYLLEPAGHAGEYDVTLSGWGDGDLFVTFRWTTPHDGRMPVPHGRLAVRANHDGAVDSYGVELEVADLAATPAEATAEVTVTAANGESLTFQPTLQPGCRSEGTLYWQGPDEAGQDAAGLGPAPFTYRVVVTLDGVEHSALARWPMDEIAGNEPSVALRFAPELPALR